MGQYGYTRIKKYGKMTRPYCFLFIDQAHCFLEKEKEARMEGEGWKDREMESRRLVQYREKYSLTFLSVTSYRIRGLHYCVVTLQL